jgi:DNA-binding MarR family transcriptional regulator
LNDVSALFEIFPICQKFLLNTIDIPSMDLTKTQILILFALSGGRPLNMSQLSSYLASSKEQATRAVSPLVKDEYVTRFRSDENRKMVYVKLTDKGNQLILKEKALVKDYLSKRFESLSKEDQESFHQSLSNILTILKKME